MWPPPWMIEQIKRREQQRRDEAVVPLHIPAPEPPSRRRPDDWPLREPAGEERQEDRSGGVLIIDLNDYTETRM